MKQTLFILIMVILWVIPSSIFADDRSDKCEPYRLQIESILVDEGLSPEYFYLAVCESTCKLKVSNKGAKGFFQVTKSTFDTYKDSNCTNINDIKCNTISAARYIKHLKKRFKTMQDIVKAYNRGGTNLIKHGSTKEADNLSYCVMKYVKLNKNT